MNRWLSPELVAAVDSQLTAPGAARGGQSIPGSQAGPTRGWERQAGKRISRTVSTLALRGAVALLLGACATFSYVALSEAAAGLLQKPAAPAVAKIPAAERALRVEEADRPAPAAVDLAPAKERVRSLREANYLLRIRLSELEEALERPVTAPEAEEFPGAQAPEAYTSEG